MEAHDEQTHRVTALELFFDLVFVFAITQVTGLMSADPSWSGLGEGLLVLAALWWAWGAYTWLTNAVNADEGAVRLAMMVVALAVPEAFGDEAVLFAVAYLAVRLIHLALYAVGTRRDRDMLAAVLRMTPTSVLAPLLLVGAGFLDGAAQAGVWLVALAADYLGVLVGRAAGWRLAPGHFAERHGLIVIIALGESIVALGVGAGAGGLELDAGVVAAAVLGIAVISALWWAYFDVVAIVAERRLGELDGRERAALARDSYSYLHLPMIAGIVLFALGLKKTLGEVGDPLSAVPALGLCGGVALYLFAHVAFRLRNVRTLSRRRLLAAVVLLALVPAASELPALGSLALVAAVTTALIAYEAIRFREARASVRAARAAA